jgi:isopentenyl phosphate kinase
VLDHAQGCAILSGDTLGIHLSAHFQPQRFVFVTDVSGIFDKDPRQDASARLLPHVSLSDLDIVQASSSSSAHDVTGGMATKFASAIAICQSPSATMAHTPVYIVAAAATLRACR